MKEDVGEVNPAHTESMKQSGISRFAEGLIQNLLAFVVGSLVLAGLAYLVDLLSVVFVGIALAVGFGIIYITAQLVHTLRPEEVVAPPVAYPVRELQTPRPRTAPVLRPRLKHIATVSLNTEVEPFDYYSEWFEEGDIIDVEAESKEGVSFHFFVCDDEELSTNERRWVNFEYFEGKENTTQFKKRFEIPFSGMLHFIAYTPDEEEYTTVTLTISKMEN